MIFEELNFLARHCSSSIIEIGRFKENFENKLPELKGKRERLWRKYKSEDETDRFEILKEINALTEDIDKIQAQKNTCNRIIARYKEIKETYKKQIKEKEELTKLTYTSLIKKSRKLC